MVSTLFSCLVPFVNGLFQVDIKTHILLSTKVLVQTFHLLTLFLLMFRSPVPERHRENLKFCVTLLPLLLFQPSEISSHEYPGRFHYHYFPAPPTFVVM